MSKLINSLDTVTEGDNFQIFEAPDPGLAIRVNAPQDVQITFLPTHILALPRFEVLIGISNNTRSAIRIDGQTEVVNISTPNILQDSRWNDFRIIWANWMVVIFRGNERFPFMVYNLESFWPVSNYGIRAV